MSDRRRFRRNRRTGTTVFIVDNRAGMFEVIEGTTHPEEMRWATVCEDHGNYCLHSTRKLAEAFRAYPDEWCADCQEIHGEGGD